MNRFYSWQLRPTESMTASKRPRSRDGWERDRRLCYLPGRTATGVANLAIDYASRLLRSILRCLRFGAIVSAGSVSSGGELRGTAATPSMKVMMGAALPCPPLYLFAALVPFAARCTCRHRPSARSIATPSNLARCPARSLIRSAMPATPWPNLRLEKVRPSPSTTGNRWLLPPQSIPANTLIGSFLWCRSPAPNRPILSGK